MGKRTVDAILDDKAFNCMDKKTKEAFKRLYINIQGKSAQDSLPAILSFMKLFPGNLNFTNEQKRAMFNALFENSSEVEKKQIMMLMNMLGL